MSDELKPCPHCGATRGLYTLDEYGGLCSDDDLIAQIFCDNCKSAFENESANNGKELIKAWNTRAERICTPIRLKAYKTLPNGDKKFTHYNYFCSECCRPIRLKGNPSYCRHCGAKIKER